MILYKICHIPPKLKDSLYAAMHWGYKNKEKEQMYPQFQKAVGNLIWSNNLPPDSSWTGACKTKPGQP